MTSKGKLFLFFLTVSFIFTADLQAAPLKIAATILPVSDMVREIAGEGTQVITLLPPGANPHTFELSPQMIKELNGSAVIFRIGAAFDDWIAGISENLPNVRLVLLNQNIQLINQDPHYWVSVRNAKAIVEQIAKTLTEIDSANGEKYQNNLKRYLAELDQTDLKITGQLKSLATKEMITFHDGWRYFARDYGLVILDTIETSEGQEPTPKRLMRLQKVIREHNIRVLFIEPALPRSLVESIAQEFRLTLVPLDPLGAEKENRKFIDLMTNNSRRISEALSNV